MLLLHVDVRVLTDGLHSSRLAIDVGATCSPVRLVFGRMHLDSLVQRPGSVDSAAKTDDLGHVSLNWRLIPAFLVAWQRLIPYW